MAEDNFCGFDPVIATSKPYRVDTELVVSPEGCYDHFSSSESSSSSPLLEPGLRCHFDAALWTPEIEDAVADLHLLQPNLNYHRLLSRSLLETRKTQLASMAGELADGNTNTRHERSSVKHLTCFWWKNKGVCRFSDEDCLYAHHDTGHYTDPPRQIIPGEPALAGRKLDRAMRNLAIVQRSSASLSGSMNEDRQISRSSTPALDLSSPILSPLQAAHHHHHHHQSYAEINKLTSDNQFLKNLVDQNAKEKAVMVSHIEELQAENKAMKAEVEGLRTAQGQLLVAREGLQKRIQELEAHIGGVRGYNAAAYGGVGSYGRARMNSEARYLGGLLDD